MRNSDILHEAADGLRKLEDKADELGASEGFRTGIDMLGAMLVEDVMSRKEQVLAVLNCFEQIQPNDN